MQGCRKIYARTMLEPWIQNVTSKLRPMILFINSRTHCGGRSIAKQDLLVIYGLDLACQMSIVISGFRV
jgi:hypothetical protein